MLLHRNLGRKWLPGPFQLGAWILLEKSPPSSQGHSFIIIATDYFTKWVEAVPPRSTTAEVIC